jgi:hypothetical protein
MWTTSFGLPFLVFVLFHTFAVGSDGQVSTHLAEPGKEQRAIEEFNRSRGGMVSADDSGRYAYAGVIGKNYHGKDLGFNDNDLRHLRCLPYLSSLFVAEVRLSRSGFGHLKAIPNLRHLSLCEVQIWNDNDWESLGCLRRLESLELRWCDLTDAHIKALPLLIELRSLKLGRNEVTDEGLEGIVKLVNLREINLQENTRITDKCFNQLLKLPALQKVNVEYTSVTAEGVANFKKLRPGVIVDSDAR